MDASQDAAVEGSSVQTKPNVNIFREYYTQNDFFSSIEGVLKIVSAIACVATSVLFLWWDAGCAWGGAARGGAGAALGGALAMTLLSAGVAAGLPLYAPQAWLFTDIIVSTVLGVLLLVSAVLSVTLCDLSTATTTLEYVRGPLTFVNAGIMIASAVLTYVSVMRRWDASQGPVMEPQRPPPSELEV